MEIVHDDKKLTIIFDEKEDKLKASFIEWLLWNYNIKDKTVICQILNEVKPH